MTTSEKVIHEHEHLSLCCDAKPFGETDQDIDGVLLGRCSTCKENTGFYCECEGCVTCVEMLKIDREDIK